METTNISATWNGTRSAVTITATLEGQSNIKIEAGYVPNGYLFEGANTLVLDNLDHANFNMLYLRAVAMDGDNEVVETESFATIGLPHPILGIAKTCEGSKNIVDIIQKKGKECPQRWQGKVIVMGPCYGSITYTVAEDGSLDQGTVTYAFKSVNEFEQATKHSSSGSATYDVGGVRVNLAQFYDVTIGSKITYLPDNFMAFCTKYNRPLTIPKNVTSIRDAFFYHVDAYNQPIIIPETVTSIGSNFMSNCDSFNSPVKFPKRCDLTAYSYFQSSKIFNAPITFPEELINPSRVFGNYLLNNCLAFNQPIKLPRNVRRFGTGFLMSCSSFNSPIDFPDTIEGTTSLYNFMQGCTAFNQPLSFTKNLTVPEINANQGFLYGCTSFNQPLDFSNLEEINGSFMSSCSSFNQPLSCPKLRIAKNSVFGGMSAFNSPVNFPVLEEVGAGLFFNDAHVFNQPLSFPKLRSISGNFFSYCYELNSPIDLPELETISNGTYGSGYTASIGIISRGKAFESTVSMPKLKRIVSTGSRADIQSAYILTNNISSDSDVKKYGACIPSHVTLSDNIDIVPYNESTPFNVYFASASTSNGRFTTESFGDRKTVLEGGAADKFMELFPNVRTVLEFRNLYVDPPYAVLTYTNGNIVNIKDANVLIGYLTAPDYRNCFPANLTRIDLTEKCRELDVPVLSSGGIFSQTENTLTAVTGFEYLEKTVDLGSLFLRHHPYLVEFSGFPPNIEKLGSYCLGECTVLNQPLTIPASVKDFGFSFMSRLRDFVGPLTIETTDFAIDPPDGIFGCLITQSSSAPAYAQGITLSGPGAKLMKELLPDLNGPSYYRKLIDSTAPPEPSSLEDVKEWLNEGKDLPIGIEIHDTWNGQDSPLIVGSNTIINGKKAVGLFRKYVEPTSQQYNTTRNNVSYPDSLIYKYLNNDFLANCSDTLKSMISEVPVKYYNGTTNIDVTGKWHLFSTAELLGKATAVEGEPWEYWREKTKLTDPSNLNNAGRVMQDRNGQGAFWFTRTRNSSSYVYYVDQSGYINSTYTDTAGGVVPFCYILAD